MLATTLLVIIFGVLAVYLASATLRARAAARPNAVCTGSEAETGWTPVVFSGGVDCTAGDADCDDGGD